jgi:hypothetical protein
MLGMLNNQNGTILNFKDVNQLQINQWLNNNTKLMNWQNKTKLLKNEIEN